MTPPLRRAAKPLTLLLALFPLVGVLAVLTAGCEGNKSVDGPKEAATRFFEAWQEGDVEAMKEHSANGSEQLYTNLTEVGKAMGAAKRLHAEMLKKFPEK